MAIEQFFTCPLIELSEPDSKPQLVKACEEFGFFKVINHRVPIHVMTRLGHEAVRFFSLPLADKLRTGPPDPFGYGNKKIGSNGDVGSVEYLLLTTNYSNQDYQRFSSTFGEAAAENFRCVLNEYVSSVRKMACEILEMVADELKIQPRNVFSKLLMDEESDSVFRLNHYPPSDDESREKNLIGFGEHTDPQIISVLRSNNTSGLQISLRDGKWISIPPDETSFFVNVGDSLQVMTNGRLKSVRHRVVANNNNKSFGRLSMIYFGGPPLSEKIAPLPSLVKAGESESLYREFTWFDFKKSVVYNSRLADDRLRRVSLRQS
uniref:gibberellin 2beta-dioxygenase n=1 Tax=Torenia fournieri TaxID=68875 RepID=E7FLV3_9LAMI|nr:gibberellin 2-oxidase [Torenia fournieri]BAJ76664.1 gibberellin 2-oxidase [Torenia fournieri]